MKFKQMYFIMAMIVVGLAVGWYQKYLAPTGAPQYKAPGANVIILVIDCLRPDYLQTYGQERPTSPHIDQLARTGLVFKRAFSQSNWTKASMGSVFTGLYPHNHGASTPAAVLPDNLPLLSEGFQAAGYTTMGYQTNPFLGFEFKFDRGFDYYDYVWHEDAAKLVDRFIAALEEEQPKKFMAYLHFMDVHVPYEPPLELVKEFDRGYKGGRIPFHRFGKLRDQVRHGEIKLTRAEKDHVIDLYAAATRFVDDQIGRLKAYLDQTGRDDTVIIVTADHGEELWDHTSFEHGHRMYNELLHVPLIIHHPTFKRRINIDRLVRLIDLWPTAAGLIDLPLPRTQGLDALAWFRANKNQQLAAFSEAMLYGEERKAVQTSGYKLIASMDGKSVKFFNLKTDPYEQKNLSDNPTEEARITEFAQLLTEFASTGKSAESNAAGGEVSEETKKRLKALGYM